MSWRIGIGFIGSWMDAGWLNTDDENEAKKIIEEYAWQRPLKIEYIKGFEDEVLRFAQLLEEEGVSYDDVWCTYRFDVTPIGEHITLKELAEKIKKEATNAKVGKV